MNKKRQPALKIRFGKKGTKEWKDVATVWLNDGSRGPYLSPQVSSAEGKYTAHIGKAVALAAEDDEFVFRCFFDEEQISLISATEEPVEASSFEDDDIPF